MVHFVLPNSILIQSVSERSPIESVLRFSLKLKAKNVNLVKNSFPLFVSVHHDKFAVASSVKVVTLFDSISSTHPAQTGSTLTQTTKLSKTMLVSHLHLHLHIMDDSIL